MDDLRKAAEMALDALDAWLVADVTKLPIVIPQTENAVFVLRQALAQGEQEPVEISKLKAMHEVCIAVSTANKGVAFYTTPPSKPINGLAESHRWLEEKLNKPVTLADYAPLYTAPLKREWVGLTSEELATIVVEHARFPTLAAQAINDKLKEKNNG